MRELVWFLADRGLSLSRGYNSFIVSLAVLAQANIGPGKLATLLCVHLVSTLARGSRQGGQWDLPSL